MADIEITQGPLAGWTSQRVQGAPGECGEVSALLHAAGFFNTAFDMDFAYDDAEAALFLRRDLGLIHLGWHGSAEDLSRVDGFAAAH